MWRLQWKNSPQSSGQNEEDWYLLTANMQGGSSLLHYSYTGDDDTRAESGTRELLSECAAYSNSSDNQLVYSVICLPFTIGREKFTILSSSFYENLLEVWSGNISN